MNGQGPVYIEEACGCRVDHGLPRRCSKHGWLGSCPATFEAVAELPDRLCLICGEAPWQHKREEPKP